MRTPSVTYELEDTVRDFIQKVVGTSTQDFMIAAEVLFGAGLASRELTLLDGRITIHFRAGPGLESRLELLSSTARGKKTSSLEPNTISRNLPKTTSKTGQASGTGAQSAPPI